MRWGVRGGKYIGNVTQEKFRLPAEPIADVDRPFTHSAEEAYHLVLDRAGASRERDTADERVIQGIRYRTHRRTGKAIISGEAYILEDGPRPTKSSSEAMEISSETASTRTSFGPAN
jgi:hypothetical protein